MESVLQVIEAMKKIACLFQNPYNKTGFGGRQDIFYQNYTKISSEKEIIYSRKQCTHRVLGKVAMLAWIFDKCRDGKCFGAERTSQGMTCICSGCRRNEQYFNLDN